MNCAAVLIGARLADGFVMQPFGRGAAAAVLTGPVGRTARLACAFDQLVERAEERVFRQPPPFQSADVARSGGELERRLPHAGEFRNDERCLREDDDDFGRIAADELQRAIVGRLLIDGRRQLRIQVRNQLFEAFRNVHISIMDRPRRA